MNQAAKDALVALKLQERTTAAANVAAAQTTLENAQQALADAQQALALAQVALDEALAIVPEIDPDAFVTSPIPVNIAAALHPEFLGGGRYTRHANELEITTGTNFRLRMHKQDYAAGGTKRAIKANVYTLKGAIWDRAVDPKTLPLVTLATYTRIGTETLFSFYLNIPPEMPDGVLYCETHADNMTLGESLIPFCCILDRKSEFKLQPYSYSQKWNHDWYHGEPHQMLLVHKGLQGHTTLPLPHVAAQPFNTMLKASSNELVTEHIVAPPSGAAPHRFYKTKRGNWTCAGKDPYPYGDVDSAHRSLPQPLLDGPRGVGTCQMPLWVLPGRDGKTYFADPWRMCVIDKNGTIRTLFGLRQPVPVYWEDATIADCEIVGNWTDGTPGQYQWPLRSWGVCVNTRSTVSDLNAPLVGGEPPHPDDVIFYVTDNHRISPTSQKGRLLEVRFNGKIRIEPARIRVLASMNDPWQVTYDHGRNRLYVAERGNAAIAVFQISTSSPTARPHDTVTRIADFAKGAVLGFENNETVWQWNDPIAARAQPVMAPETCIYAPDIDEVIWGGKATAELRSQKVDKSAPPQRCTSVNTGNNTNFIVAARSNPDHLGRTEPGEATGPTGPIGTLYIASWGHIDWPRAFCPKAGKDDDGRVSAIKDSTGKTIGYNALDAAGNITKVFMFPAGANLTTQANILTAAKRENGTPITHAQTYDYSPPAGGVSYGTSPGVGYGRVIAGSAMHGLPQVRARVATDQPPIVSTAAKTRGAKFYADNFELRHGMRGNGWIVGDLPFGVNADCDAYMSDFERVKWAP